MNLISVIPLTRSKVAGTLSYFTASTPPVGAIVTVPLRSKNIHGIVADSRPAEEMKAEIRSAPFEIRKLGKMKATAFFPAPFMETCKKLADYSAANLGAVIDVVTNSILLENAGKIAAPAVLEKNTGEPGTDMAASGETYAVQGDDSDRISSWRSMIRQEFARKRSVTFYTPTIEDAERLRSAITKGIEEYVFILHGDLTKKKVMDTWQSMAITRHPVVIIATGSFSVLPRSDIETVIVERENSRGWISQKAPYLDMRRALEALARANGQRVYLADSVLRVETLRRLDKLEIASGSPFKWRSISTAKDSVVDMKIPKDLITRDKTPEDKDSSGRFRTISPELTELITRNRDENSHLFVFAARRGLASTTVCDDCETVVECSRCSAPVVLHPSRQNADGGGRQAKNFFMCHKCGELRSAGEVCRNCGGWRLTPLGVGIDRVFEEIYEMFPGIDLFKIDADSTKDEKEVSAVMEKFHSRPGSILVGTELAVARLPEKLDHVAVASLDSLFALPDFRMPEKIMYLLVRLRTIAERSILVQTRRAGEKVFEYGLKGNLSDFYRTTIDERKQFGYPPCKTLIKITIEGKKDEIARAMADASKSLEPYEVDVFPAFTSTVRGNSVIHGLIRTETTAWPDATLLARIHSLPPGISVKVDPESLL